MEKEILFSNLSQIAVEKKKISEKYKKGKWKTFEYNTGKCGGTMVVTPEESFPGRLTFDVKLSGYHQIYLCLPKLRSCNNLLVKLTDDMCYTKLSASWRSPKGWTEEEYFEEIYWKTADLTNQKIIIRKADSEIERSVTGLAWIRCVPVNTPSPAITNRPMQMHLDVDDAASSSFETDIQRLLALYPMKDANAEFVSMEFAFDYDGTPMPKDGHLLRVDRLWTKAHNKYRKKKDFVYRNAVKFAHENNFGLYAANRMEVGNFIPPFTRYSWNCNFAEDHPEYYCKSRLGTNIRVCSYAYPEVQDYVIKTFTDMLGYGFDGITLIYHRGLYIAFDEPVIERFHELYPDIDPHTLPMSDERLNGVWCEFMNTFMQKLRTAVDAVSDKHIKINITADYSLATSKHLGLDIATWAENGWIDSVAQADMETVELLDGCMSDENPNLIDLDKYRKVLSERAIIKRNYGTNMEKVCVHIPEYRQLERFGVDVFHVLPWVHQFAAEEYEQIFKQMEQAGAEKFLSWNTNHMLSDLPEWHTVSRYGNESEDVCLRRFHRVLSFAGNDISQFHPNWRG